MSLLCHSPIPNSKARNIKPISKEEKAKNLYNKNRPTKLRHLIQYLKELEIKRIE
jgi:hypothetical protein